MRSIEAAEAIAECRDFSNHGRDTDSASEASQFGRDGGSCSAQYLCDSGCKYNPHSETCTKTNCWWECNLNLLVL